MFYCTYFIVNIFFIVLSNSFAVYNEKEGSLYVHHDLLLPSFPLCVEWLDFEPGHPQGSYCAIGSMEPQIDVWDLDVVNCLEPAYTLGRKGSRKKRIAHVGHYDAVLDLAWNQNFHHILASGSADKKLILWDIERLEPSVTIKSFTDKVQCLEWHKFETQSLLAGVQKNAITSSAFYYCLLNLFLRSPLLLLMFCRGL